MSAEVYHHRRRGHKRTVPPSNKHKEDNCSHLQGGVGVDPFAARREQRLIEGSGSITTSTAVHVPNINKRCLPRTITTNVAKPLQKRLSDKKEAGSKTEDQHQAATFGDLERICVKSLKEAYFTKDHQCPEDNELRDYVSHLLKLSRIYRDSVKETGNIYNVLRATGLLNLCLRLSADDDNMQEQIIERLLSMESVVLKRVMKIKSAEPTGFFKARVNLHLAEDLTNMRDVFNADFHLLTECIKELPDEQDLLENETLTAKQLLAEDKIIAVVSMMEAEVFERGKAILGVMFMQCLNLLGRCPCRFALLKLKDSNDRLLTPYNPWSCFLLIEKDTAAVKAYFRNALTLFSMKVADIGETNLANLNIRSLDFIVPDLYEMSGFSLVNHIAISTGSTRPLIDCMRSPDDLIRSSTSSKIKERDLVYSICGGSQFIVGDHRLSKELPTIRQMVIQRQQVDVEYTGRMLQSFDKLVTKINRIQNIGPSEKQSHRYQSEAFNTIFAIQTIMFDLVKELTTDSTKGRLEEVTISGYRPPSSLLSIITEKEESGLQSRFSGSLEDMVLPQMKQSWNHHEANAYISDISRQPPTVLQELKYIKSERLPIESIDIRQQMLLSLKDNSERVLNKSESENLIIISPKESDARPRKEQPKFVTPKRPPKKQIQPKNASNRVQAVAKMKAPLVESPIMSTSTTPEEPEPIEVFDRKVGSSPNFTGKQRNLIGGNVAHHWLLLNYLVKIMEYAKQKKPMVVTGHELPRLDQLALDRVYRKALQILLPTIETLKEISKNAGNLTALKNMLYGNIDFLSNANELAVSLVCIQDERYEDGCQAVYKYLEHRSDVTFIGEPFPVDFIEVSQELLEDRKISRERYQLLLTLMANCREKQGNHGEAIEYWKMLLVMTTDVEISADIHRHLAQCYLALENEESALEMATRSLELYEELPKERRRDQVEELRKLLDGIES